MENINDKGLNNLNNKNRDEKGNSEKHHLQPDEEDIEISQEEQESGTGQKKDTEPTNKENILEITIETLTVENKKQKRELADLRPGLKERDKDLDAEIKGADNLSRRLGTNNKEKEEIRDVNSQLKTTIR